MRKRNWKRVHATSLRHALELTKDFARENHNLSVDGISVHMGMADHFTLYKWFQNGRMPLVLLPAFEKACGAHFVTRWLAAKAGFMTIPMPTGRNGSAQDMNELNTVLHHAVGRLLAFYAGDSEAEETLAALTHGIEQLAWHRANVDQHRQPGLDFEGDRA